MKGGKQDVSYLPLCSWFVPHYLPFLSSSCSLYVCESYDNLTLQHYNYPGELSLNFPGFLAVKVSFTIRSPPSRNQHVAFDFLAAVLTDRRRSSL